jgi:hypothetical protein
MTRASGTTTRLSAPILVLAICAAVAGSGAPARAATAAPSCRASLSGPRWTIGGASGSTYQIAARGVSCATVRPFVTRFLAHPVPLGTVMHGPAGYRCHSFSQGAAGAKLIASGVCTHGPHNTPFFGWGPKP